MVKLGKSWPAKGVKWCKNEDVNSSEGLKRAKSWAAKGDKMV